MPHFSVVEILVKHCSLYTKHYSVIDSRKNSRYKSTIWPDTTKTDERGPKNSYRAFSLRWPASMLIYCTKEGLYIRKEFNSHRVVLVHQHGRQHVKTLYIIIIELFKFQLSYSASCMAATPPKILYCGQALQATF